jgi:two-component system NarL family sensor kinase
MLEEMGLGSALLSYTEGFAQRSKITVNSEISPDLGRLPQEYELCLFRVVQECLTNVHRHSGSSTATIRLSRLPGKICLEVSDNGKGMDESVKTKIASSASAGVGMRGMQERIKLLHGQMILHSDQNGTSILVELPVNAPGI